MAGDDTRDTGIPTRAIHEAYLGMQDAHRRFRQARDDLDATEAEQRRAQRKYQEGVLTYYEFIRPHLIHESGLSAYWDGDLPEYTNAWEFASENEAADYVREHGTGVYQVQIHPEAVQLQQQTLADGGLQTWEGWHEFLSLSWDSERLLAVNNDTEGAGENTHVVKILRAAVLPLKELDHWRARQQTVRESGNGFMAAETHEQVRHEFEPDQRITAAKRLLVEATDKLGLLSGVDFDEPREAGGIYADALDPDVTPEDLDNA